MSGTRFDPMGASGDGDAEQLAPESPMTVADCAGLAQRQAFDVTALVEEVGDEREVSSTRVVRDVILVDGSKINGTLQQIKLSFYYSIEMSSNDQECMDLLSRAVGTTTPLSFFAIQGNR